MLFGELADYIRNGYRTEKKLDNLDTQNDGKASAMSK